MLYIIIRIHKIYHCIVVSMPEETHVHAPV
jgi:hypothetical protein